MIIQWYGQFCFRIQSGEVNILIDPPEKESGLRSPRNGANILILSSPNSSFDLAKLKDEVFLINGPGEYELKGVFIQGENIKDHQQKAQSLIYTIKIEGVKICHLGNLQKEVLSEKEIEILGDVDILMVPVGGKTNIDSEGASKIINQIESRIIIPMQYKIPGLKLNLDKVEKFLKTMGQKKVEELPKLVIKKKDLPQEETRIAVLKPA